MFGWLMRLLRARDGSVLVMGALSLVSVLGMSGLAVEVGNAYSLKVQHQRIADVAALSAALAYKASPSGGQSLLTATAQDVAQANGLARTAATAQLSSDSIQVTVTINTSIPLILTRVITNQLTLPITNTAVASLPSSDTTACVTVLNSGSSAVYADGGAKLTAAGCAINTNGTVYSTNSSAAITAKQFTAQAINDKSGSGINTTPTAHNWKLKTGGASDGILTGNSAVQTDLCYVNKLTNATDTYDKNTNPEGYAGGNTNCASPLITAKPLSNTGSTDWTLDWGQKTTSGLDQYLTSSYSCSYVIPAGTYTVGKLTVPGGCKITFQGTSTLRFDSIDASGDTVVFPDGSMTVSGAFSVNANNPVKVGNGTHWFGSLTAYNGKKIDIGSGDFTVTGLLAGSGQGYIRVGLAAGNAVTVGNDGANPNPTSISSSGSFQLCFTADCTAPTVVAGTFSANGSVTEPNSGSTIVFPNAAIHVIAGDLNLTAAAIFGKGLYIIKGNWTNGTGCGGCVMQGTDVTFAMGGTINFAGGSYYDLAAPTAASGYGVPDMLILTKSNGGTTLSGGANGKVSGMIYAPNSAFSSTGGSSISSNGSQCMMLLVNSLSVTQGGTVNTANCPSMASTSSGTVALIQ